MAAEDRAGLLGRIAYQHNLITMGQLADATREQGRLGDKRLGEILVEKGYLSAEQLAELLELQRRHVAPAPAPSSTGYVKPAGDPDTWRRQYSPSTSGNHRAPAAGRSSQNHPLTTQQPTSQQHSEELRWLDTQLAQGVSAGASDLLVQPELPVKLRRSGVLADLSEDELSIEDVDAVLRAALTETQQQILDNDGQVDFGYSVAGVGRFRGSVYMQIRGLCGVYHFLPERPPTLQQLGLPSDLARLANYQQGLVLVGGPAGSGRTSTVAALLDLINEEHNHHILTLEDPIEYIHTSKRCIVSQREVSRHTLSFQRALSSALHEDPNVIFIGELRDPKTTAAALAAAQSGHLVFATIHTSSAIRTIERVLGSYQSREQSHARSMLSESLLAVVSQRLIPRCDQDGVALALELLYVTKDVGDLIRADRVGEIAQILDAAQGHGMWSLDYSLSGLVRAGIIRQPQPTTGIPGALTRG